MKRRTAAFAMMFILMFAALSTAPALVGHARASAGAEDVVLSPDPAPEVDTVLGVYAAFGCGLFGRALMGGMVFPGVIAGALATCGYMFFDALVLER
jgi:hypothetical protein